MLDSTHLILLIVSWLLYFLLHSLLASLEVKNWFSAKFPDMVRWYRLGYNLLALLLLVIPVWLTFARPSPLIIEWQGEAKIISLSLTMLAIAGLLLAASIYDGSQFLGLSQARQKDTKTIDQEPFRISWLHRYVRHPWYFLGLMFIWSRNMDSYLLTSSIMITLYLIVGSRLEEKKLVSFYGDTYRMYRQKVPGLIPLPWRYITRQQASSLLDKL